MRLFLITSDKFIGTAELYYNQEGVLIMISASDTNMDVPTIDHFKRAAPASLELLMSGKSFGPGTTVVEKGYRVMFETWWKAYNKKINKARCIPLYDRLNDAETVLALNGIKVYDRFLAEEKVRQKLDPENYLKLKAWENEWKK